MAELSEAGMRRSLKDWPLGRSVARIWEIVVLSMVYVASRFHPFPPL